MILIDTNVLVDVALDRIPHSAVATQLLSRIDQGEERGAVAWHTMATVYYLVSKGRGKDAARSFVLRISRFLSVAPTDDASFRYAMNLPLPDFEDAMQVAAARACGARLIVTRDGNDFRGSPIRAVDPETMLAELR